MGKLSHHPGCKQGFLNGCAYSVHITCCKALNSAMDSALTKHKIIAAKKAEAKWLEVAAQKGLTVQDVLNQAASGSQGSLNSDDRHMPVDIDITVNKVPPAQNSPSLPPQPSGHPNRQIWLPLHYHDKLPPNPPIISVSKELVDEPVQFMGCASPETIPIPKDTEFCTETNTFGVYHKYTFGPLTFNPNKSFTLSSVSNSISIAHNFLLILQGGHLLAHQLWKLWKMLITSAHFKSFNHPVNVVVLQWIQYKILCRCQ